jgi:hypothetical protein
MAFEEVVPTVAVTKKGFRPASRSARIRSSRAGADIAKRSSTAMSRRFALPIPAILAAFSIDEWAWVEVYATRSPRQPS